MILERRMFVLFLLLGTVLSVPNDEFKDLTKNTYGDFEQNKDKVHIVPSGYISASFQLQSNRYIAIDKNEWAEIIEPIQFNKYFKMFNIHLEKGLLSNDLTFCIYNDDMREAAINLFRLFQTIGNGEAFAKFKEWTKRNINKEIYMYALRLESLHSSKTRSDSLLPPFVWNPHYFVNSETLTKASLIVNNLITNGDINKQMAKTDQYGYVASSLKPFVIINSNYSGWNLPKSAKADKLDYFREDVGLNSYYFGVHLLHPFWMSDEELEFNNPRYAEHYYYAHQQLLARYNLEKQHKIVENSSFKEDVWDYAPYLRYKNGLPFPTRFCVLRDWNEEEAYIKSVDIAIRECISRGLLIMQNGTTVTMTDDSHINILAKLLRANLDGIKFAKISRSIVGYGDNFYPIDEYTPAPSLLHHPETSLRDPAYWSMIKLMLDYFKEYKNTMLPFDLSQYESEEYAIVDNDFTKLETGFDDFTFSINLATSYNMVNENDDWPVYATAKQRRLTHQPFSFNFTVESMVKKNTIVRLYLGPACSGSNCWKKYDEFFELDTFPFTLQESLNFVIWNPESSNSISFDDDYNTVPPKTGSAKYSMFRFPENLILPKGHKDGLNLTLFVMITPADDNTAPFPPTSYREVSNEADSKPLGFPFHRQAKGFKDTALNYRFYNISIFHEKKVPLNGNFSPHLY